MYVTWLLEHLLKYLKASNYLFSSAGCIFISNDTNDDNPPAFLLDQLVRCSWRAYFLSFWGTCDTLHYILSVFEYCQVPSNLWLFHTVLLTLPPAAWVASTPLSVQCTVSLRLPCCSLVRQTGEPLKNVNTVFGKVCVWHSDQWSL